MNHLQALVLMTSSTLLWSIAGVVTRHLYSARSFEITFWRSFFTVVTLLLMLFVPRLRKAVGAGLAAGPRRNPALYISGFCWAVMFTAFMVALTLTSTANVLVTMAAGPLFTAVLSRLLIGERLPLRTGWAIGVAFAGIAWMFAGDMTAGGWVGSSVALMVPVAAALNWTLVQRGRRHGSQVDLGPAVLIGAALSTLATLPLAWPFSAPAHDIALLALLGAVQLAIPCLLAMQCARVLAAPEVALIALLEVVFGIAWAWLGAGEVPGTRVLSGGALVVGALAVNQLLALHGGAVAARSSS